jgi:hypothetical protein
MYACVCEIGGGFFAGVYGSKNRPVISCDPPCPAMRELVCASTIFRDSRRSGSLFDAPTRTRAMQDARYGLRRIHHLDAG